MWRYSADGERANNEGGVGSDLRWTWRVNSAKLRFDTSDTEKNSDKNDENSLTKAIDIGNFLSRVSLVNEKSGLNRIRIPVLRHSKREQNMLHMERTTAYLVNAQNLAPEA